MVSIPGQNIICSKICLDGTTHEQTVIVVGSYYFAGHLVDSQPLKGRKNASNDNNICWQLQTIRFIHPVP